MKRLMLTFAALSLGGCAGQAAGRLPPVAPGAQYVAMGSSYAAGAGIGPLQQGAPVRCQRTTNNYASLAAKQLHLVLVDASCGGATTTHLLEPWEELPPQIEAVTADTKLVTVTVGGNDLGFVMTLFGGSCRAGVSLRPGPCAGASSPDEAQLAEVEAGLRAVARAVHARAPGAVLVFVQYLTVVPPSACKDAVVTPGDAQIAAQTARRLAEITARVAAEEGARLIPADTLSRDHTPCSAEPWSHGLSVGYDMKQGAPWHPNAAGHAAIARELVRLLSR